ncbi:MAG: nitroreductase family protein, partial [Oscillospiraceae bacterium]|nr:nitroreductase family protein [Oscillospiraceae bacterium]
EAAKAPDYHNFYHAPAAIIVSGETREVGQDRVIADCANASQNICVAAQSLGLGTCYIASFTFCLSSPLGDFMYEALKLPEGYKPLFAVAVGYPDETPNERAPRREGTVAYIG